MTELWHDAFLLHQRPYGNTSVIAEMFTLENGRISVIARGAKKPKSKFFGVLSPFSKLRITYRGRSELKTLTNVDKEDILNVRQDPEVFMDVQTLFSFSFEKWCCQ